MDATTIKPNYYALVVAILTKCPPELAFAKLESDHPGNIRLHLTQDDLEDIAALRTEGITWDDLGEMYGKRPDVLLRALKRKRLGRWQPMSRVGGDYSEL